MNVGYQPIRLTTLKLFYFFSSAGLGRIGLPSFGRQPTVIPIYEHPKCRPLATHHGLDPSPIMVSLLTVPKPCPSAMLRLLDSNQNLTP